VFERFTERARQVVVRAQEEARALGHDYIGTEYILLGLLREEEGLAARVLESLDVTVEEVRAQVTRVIGEGEPVATGQIPFTPRAKNVLELSLREALSLGHNYIGTEHILLGLARENQGVAARILLDFGVDGETVRDEVTRMVTGTSSPLPEVERPPSCRRVPRETLRSASRASRRRRSRRSSGRTSSRPCGCARKSDRSPARRESVRRGRGSRQTSGQA
jgi:ATP-dependent Clp protease ATP-binding subunit ClpA